MVQGGGDPVDGVRPMVDSLLVDALTFDSSLADDLRSFVSGSEVISYYIHVSGTPEDVNGYGVVDTNAIGLEDQSFIDSIFKWLDDRIDLDFVRQSDYNGTAIDLYSLQAIPGEEGDVIGLTSPQAGWYDVNWVQMDPLRAATVSERLTILHEICHALGLLHPNDLPDDPAYDTSDTVMSYNEDLSRSPWLTDSDLAALQRFWGVENDVPLPSSVDGPPGVRLIGTRRKDRLIGGDHGDYFDGKSGNDRIITGGSSSLDPDQVWTGSGKDRVYLSDKSYVQIGDFTVGRDAIWIDTSTPEQLSLSADRSDALILLGSAVVARVVGQADQLLIGSGGWVV